MNMIYRSNHSHMRKNRNKTTKTKPVGIMAYYWNGGYTIGMVAKLLKRWLTIGMVAILLEWWLYY